MEPLRDCSYDGTARIAWTEAALGVKSRLFEALRAGKAGAPINMFPPPEETSCPALNRGTTHGRDVVASDNKNEEKAGKTGESMQGKKSKYPVLLSYQIPRSFPPSVPTGSGDTEGLFTTSFFFSATRAR